MIEQTKDGVRLHLFVQPKASKNEIVGPHNGALKIRITAPPIDGKANDEIILFLAKTLKCPKSKIQILKGDTGRLKSVLIQGIDFNAAKQMLGIE